MAAGVGSAQVSYNAQLYSTQPRGVRRDIDPGFGAQSPLSPALSQRVLCKQPFIFRNWWCRSVSLESTWCCDKNLHLADYTLRLP